MKNIKLLFLSAILLMSVGFTPVGTNHVYAGSDEEEEVDPFDEPQGGGTEVCLIASWFICWTMY